MYKKSDITRFAVAILWVVVAIRHIIKIVDSTKIIKEYEESVRHYGYGSEDKAVKILKFEIFIMVCLAVISVICAYVLVIRQLNKYGIFTIVYAVFATAIVVAVVVYLKSLSGSLSRLGSNFTVGGLLMYALMYGSIVVMGFYCKKSDEGQRYDIKIFIPVLIYLGGVLCRVIFFSSKSDGTDSLIINGFGENLIWVGILSLTGLYIYFMEKESSYIGYAGYYGYPPMGTMPGQTTGYPPMGTMPGQTMGYPPMGTMPGQTMGYPPMGTMPGQTMGYPPMGTVPGQPINYPPLNTFKNPTMNNTKMINKCKSCGTLLNNNAKFCYVCGNKVSE